jgi:hypothetical protein
VPASVHPDFAGVEVGLSATVDIFEAIARRANTKVSELVKGLEAYRPVQTALLRISWDNGDRTVLVNPGLGGATFGWNLHSLGSGIMALLAAGTFKSINEAQEAMCLNYRTFKPNPKAAGIYAKLYVPYRKTYFALASPMPLRRRWVIFLLSCGRSPKSLAHNLPHNENLEARLNPEAFLYGLGIGVEVRLAPNARNTGRRASERVLCFALSGAVMISRALEGIAPCLITIGGLPVQTAKVIVITLKSGLTVTDAGACANRAGIG